MSRTTTPDDRPARTPVREGDLLWLPSDRLRREARLTAFLDFVARTRGVELPDYEAAWRWSVDDLEGFWGSVADFFAVPFRSPPERVLADPVMPGTVWFPGATLNYVDAVLAQATDERPALLVSSEREPLHEVAWADLLRDVAAAAAGLRRLGVCRGDRVGGFLPNIPEAVIGFLASASLGAIWTSCAPEFGARSVVDRFIQVEPTVLIAVDAYEYGGRTFDRRAVVEEIRAALPSLRATVLVPAPGSEGPSDAPGWMSWAEFLRAPGPVAPLEPEPVPFDHPLWILFSSGTTGLPKPIVHGHGGVVLEHLKELGLQLDVRGGDRMLWHTTTGWMMWNFLVGNLLAGGVPILYDGSPGHPDLGVLWRLGAEAGASHLGMSAAFLMACRKGGFRPAEVVDLTALRCLGSTGSPLPVEGFEWVYEAVSSDLLLASVSGGTDVVSAFVGGSPLLAVRAGELQCRSLGALVEAFGPDGRPVAAGETGELVLTAPLPSMPVAFWNDPDGSRLAEAYFGHFPGVWRHGDWIRFTSSGGVVIEGRSDSTLNRHGVRFGTSDIYGVIDAFPEIADSLVIGLEEPDNGYWMPLFVMLAPGAVLDRALQNRIVAAIRTHLSPRHVPDEIIAVPRIPRTLTGKKMEVPVKLLLSGYALESVASLGAMADTGALDSFVALAAARQAERSVSRVAEAGGSTVEGSR